MKRTLSSLALAVLMAASAVGTEQWAVGETSFTSAKKCENPFVDVEVDVVFRTDRFTFSTSDPYERQSPLPPFGLLGPVQLLTQHPETTK